MALVANVAAGLLVHVGAAAGGEHLWTGLQQPGNDPALAVAKLALAMVGEDLGYGFTGRLLDLGVGIDERDGEKAGQAPADGGLAGAHEADQHDRALVQMPPDFLYVVA
jgi:hypothetical protein